MGGEQRPGLLRSPVFQFLVGSIVVVLIALVGTEVLSRKAAEREAIHDARVTTELLAHNVVEPNTTIGFADGQPVSLVSFDEIARARLLPVSGVVRVKIWRPDGTIVYSDQADLMGKRFPLNAKARKVLADGRSGSGLSRLKKPENEYEVGESGLLEVYTRIEVQDRPMLLEVYYSSDDLADSSATVLAGFRPVILGGLLLLVLLTVPLLWGMTGRLKRSAQARERLLRNAVESSRAERRRIAWDLNDSVVQVLVDASGELSSVAAESVEPSVAQRLRAVDTQLRGSVRSLRSMAQEIDPPKLGAGRLADALDELVVPATAAGLDVRLSVDSVEGVSDDAAALVWRAAQEAVRNSLRHARGGRLDVSVRRSGPLVSLRVADDGVGFVPGTHSGRGRLGLRSLHELAMEAGGRLDVETGPGRGTTVLLDVPAAPTRLG